MGRYKGGTDNIFFFFFYLSGQAHSSVERAGLLGGVKFHLLEVDSKYKLRGESLAEAIRKDKEQGFIPFYVSFLSKQFERRIRVGD